MPAASSHRSSAASLDARRTAANPWVVDLRELGRRPGSMHEIERTVSAPADWRVELIGVPEGAPVALRLRLESVMEGVLVSGEVELSVTGQCARCLEPLEQALRLDVQELFAYAGSTTEATSEEDEVRRVDGDFIDLEPMLRDAVVLSLPLAPLCDEECRGLCAGCGQRLDDLPENHTHEALDPRWAGLADRFAAAPGGPVHGHPADNPEEN